MAELPRARVPTAAVQPRDDGDGEAADNVGGTVRACRVCMSDEVV